MKIKFITLNVWLGGILFEAILDFLKNEKPDILVCQEVYDGKDPSLERRFRSFDLLKQKLQFTNATFASAFQQNIEGAGKVASGNAIFSNFPIVPIKTTFYDVPYNPDFAKPPSDFSYTPRNLQQAVLTANGIQLNVFNTQGIWGFDGKDTERRLKMGETIAREVKGEENVVLAGDFNMDPEAKAMAKVEKHLKNVFKNELKTSFNMKRKTNPGYATAVVDMVFVSKKIEVLEHYCPQADVSDHLPLVCRLEI